MFKLGREPAAPLRPARAFWPTVALLAAFYLELAAGPVVFLRYYPSKALCFLLIVPPTVIYCLLGSGRATAISRFRSEVLILLTLVVLGLIGLAAAIIEAPHGQNSWRIWLEGVGIGLADILVVMVIFALLRQAGRSAWWACLWIFSIGPVMEPGMFLWIPATLLLSASLLAYGSSLRRWAGVCLALSTLACPFVVPVVLTGVFGLWQDKKGGRISRSDAAFIIASFSVVMFVAALVLLAWPAAIHHWLGSSMASVDYSHWPGIFLLAHSPGLVDLCLSVAWLIGVVTAAIAAVRYQWSFARTSLHLCVLSMIFCPFYLVPLLLPILILGALAWNGSALWLSTVGVYLILTLPGRYLGMAWDQWWLLYWAGAVALEFIQIIADLRQRPKSPDVRGTAPSGTAYEGENL
jgi:hypothetical protein